jgi:hypothetical protein
MTMSELDREREWMNDYVKDRRRRRIPPAGVPMEGEETSCTYPDAWPLPADEWFEDAA